MSLSCKECGVGITPRSKTGRCQPCSTSYSNKTREPMSKEKNPAWKGYKGMPYNWFSKYFERGRNKRSGSITLQEVYVLYLHQEGYCALTGQSLTWGPLEDGTYNISIDRIDSSKEYELDNIQLVHKDVNIMKNQFSQEYFIQVCQWVVDCQT